MVKKVLSFARGRDAMEHHIRRDERADDMTEFISNGVGVPASPTDAEIGALISDILKQGSTTFDPSRDVLGELETFVEQAARESARNEIGAMVKEVTDRKRTAAPILVTPTPQPVRSPAPRWVHDAMLAKQAQIEEEGLWTRGQADETALLPGIAAEYVEDARPANTGFVDDLEEVEIAYAPVAAAAGGNDWFGHSPEGLPVWMTAGIPVAAVSLFALAAVFADAPDEADLIEGLDAPIETVAALPSVTSGVLTSGDYQALGDSLPTTTLISHTPSADLIAPVPESRRGAGIVTAEARASDAALAPVAANYIVKERIEPLVKEAPAVPTPPSFKPDAPTVTVPEVTKSLPTPDARPNNELPVRIYTGDMPAGSAAAIVNSIASEAGSNLTRMEQAWLAADVERAFENEIDGRSVSLKAEDGQRIRLTLSKSGQVQRGYEFTRAAEISALPQDLVLKGGWYAARKDVMLHAAPSQNSGLTHRVVKKNELIERMASYTDRFGAKWYLMGQNGLAVGFVSPDELMLAGAQKGQLGYAYSHIPGASVREVRRVFTQCRDSWIGPEGDLVQSLKVCRNPEGNWVDHAEGEHPAELVNMASVMNQANDTVTDLVLAEAFGDDPLSFHAFSDRKFQARIQNDLLNARAGRVATHALPNGDDIKLTFGDTFTEETLAPVRQDSGLIAVPGQMRVDSRWVKAPIGATLRAAPDPLAQASLTEIPAGRAVEKIGHVTGTRGDDWVLVGRDGVGFGYMAAAKLTPIEGRVSPKAVENTRGRSVAELVEVKTTCRPVSYKTTGLRSGVFIACQKADGAWALKGKGKQARLIQLASARRDLGNAL